MKLFDKLFGKKQNNESISIINVRDDGIFINDSKIAFPISVTELSAILGEPTRQYWEDNMWQIIWDDTGICAECGVLDNIINLRILINPEKNLKHLPLYVFKGKVLINGQSSEKVPESTKINKYQLGKLRYKGDMNNKIYAYYIMKNYDYKEQKNHNKYKFQKIKGEKIEFTDFNFKLAIIEELMYIKNILQPRFDVFEFAELYDKREINIEEEAYKPIPEVIDYFKKLEIDKKLAEQITGIYQDGGNEIYGNIIPYWDGEDNYFDIRSYEDIRHFPNIKKMTLFSTDPKIFEELKSKGIDAEPL